MTKTKASVRSSGSSSSNQKIFGIRGFDLALAKSMKRLALEQEKSMRELFEEAARDILKKYK